MLSVALEIKNLSKRFGGLQAIDHVNLTFKLWELRCLIGPNGAGKTTLFNLITGRIKPNEGRILFATIGSAAWPEIDVGPPRLVSSIDQLQDIMQGYDAGIVIAPRVLSLEGLTKSVALLVPKAS